MKINDIINNIIIAGNFNQSIASNEIKRFYEDIRVKNIYNSYNTILLNELNKIHIGRSTPVNLIAVL